MTLINNNPISNKIKSSKIITIEEEETTQETRLI